MPSLKMTFVAALCMSLTLAAVAQTRTGTRTPSPTSSQTTPSSAELFETIQQLQNRVATLEKLLAVKPEKLDLSLVRFGDCTVNLISDRANRYLRMSLVLAVAPEQHKVTAEAVRSLRPRLKNWLFMHLADKSLSDVRGRAGLDRLREEIQIGVNSVLKAEGFPESVNAILFEEFNIQ